MRLVQQVDLERSEAENDALRARVEELDHAHSAEQRMRLLAEARVEELEADLAREQAATDRASVANFRRALAEVERGGTEDANR